MKRELIRYFAKRPDPYAGAVVETLRLITGAVAVVSSLISLALLGAAPPTSDVGNVGWPIAAAALAATAAAGVSALRRSLDWQGIALVQWTGLLALAALVWLTGGNESPQTPLLLLWIVVFAACHPARRAAAFLLVAAVVALAPLGYDGAEPSAAGEAGTELVVWFVLAAIANVWVASIRADRLRRVQNEEQAVSLARTDVLTGLRNRRAFEEELDLLIGRAGRDATPLSVVVADLDRFKEVNDRFGHLSGDRCLREVAAALRHVVRDAELIYRWGGDEFAILLPNVEHADAQEICARIATAVGDSCADPDGRALAVSCGHAHLHAGMDAHELIAAADLALLARKTIPEPDSAAPHPAGPGPAGSPQTPGGRAPALGSPSSRPA
jgi:diguanylate cyclase (GGDEF)-like protein